MAVIHSYVFCISYKYINLFSDNFDSLAVALYKIEGNSSTFDPDTQLQHIRVV